MTLVLKQDTKRQLRPARDRDLPAARACSSNSESLIAPAARTENWTHTVMRRLAMRPIAKWLLLLLVIT
jgi:hypothetical protein